MVRGTMRLAVAAALALLVSAGVSSADTILRFDLGGSIAQEGDISWGGGASPLVGSDINFSFIDLEVNGATVASLSCDEAVVGTNSCMELNFQTGAFSGNTATDDYNWGQGAGWFFEITTTADNAILGLSAGTVLVQGTALHSANLVPGAVTLTGVDIKHEEILEFFFGADIPSSFSFVSTNIQIGVTPRTAANGFDVPVLNADVINTAPAPGAAWLLAMGLSALVVSRRRKA